MTRNRVFVIGEIRSPRINRIAGTFNETTVPLDASRKVNLILLGKHAR